MSPHKISEIEKKIREKIHALRKKDERVRIASGILFVCAAGIASFGFISILEGLFYFSSAIRAMLVIVSSVMIIVVGIVFLLLPLFSTLGFLKRKPDLELARTIGKHFPNIKDRLYNLLQIGEERKKGTLRYSAELIDASYGDLAEEIEKNDFTQSVQFQKPAHIGRSVLYGLAFFGLLYLISPQNFGDAMHRIIHFNQEFEIPRSFTLSIRPGDIDIVRGDDVTIYIQITGDPQPDVSLFTRQEGQIDFEKFVIDEKSGTTFVHRLAGIRRTTEYYAVRNDQKTTKHTITALDRPSVRNLQVTLDYPGYTGLSTRVLDENAGNITAIRGTTAAIELVSNKDLTDAKLVFRDRDDIKMEIDGKQAHTRFTVDRNDRYHIMLEDTDGIPSTDPIEFTVRVIEDEHPIVTIVEPGRDIYIGEDLRLPMLIRLQDDFGFSGLHLAYRLQQSRFEQTHGDFTYLDIPLPRNIGNDEIIDFVWSVREQMILAPEDVVAYYAVVYDNDRVSGPKSGKSDVYIFRLPSLDEIFAEMDRKQSQSLDDLEYSVEEAEKLRRDLENIQRELQLAQHEMNWERQQRMQDMLERYDELQQNLDQLSRDLEEMVDEMQRQNVLSPETLEKYLELQELYEQLSDPEFKEAMERLHEAMNKMDPNELREAMRNFSFNEEQFRQTIERTLNLLKRIQIEQKVDELLKRSEQMVQDQKAFEEGMEAMDSTGSETSGQREEQLDDLKQQLDRMMEELAELQRRMEQFPAEMPLDDLQKTMDDMTSADMQQQIEQMQQQMQQGNMQQARQQQQQLQQDVSRLQQNIAQMQQSLLEDQIRRIVNEMRRALRNINELSKRQEELRDDTRSLEPNSQLFRDNARRQNEVMSDLNNVVNDLVELSQKTFAITPDMGRAIGQSFQQMQEALERLDSRSGTQASQQQGGAMSSLNEASLMLQESLQAMMQGGGQGGMAGFLQQLQMMAGQQQQINLSTRELGQGQMTMEQQAQMARLAAEQDAVRRSLEELQHEMESSRTRDRVLGDLERIEREMREVVRGLSADDLQPETLQRQERILSRLLDAQRSIRERDYEERREGRVADQILRDSPPEIDLSTKEGRDRLREDMLRAVREGYTRDYEQLIRRYFELLQELERE
jgi:hypothetical protein